MRRHILFFAILFAFATSAHAQATGSDCSQSNQPTKTWNQDRPLQSLLPESVGHKPRIPVRVYGISRHGSTGLLAMPGGSLQQPTTAATAVRLLLPISQSGLLPADVMSVWYRAGMLWALKQVQPDLLAQWTHNGELDDAVFQVAATFPMEKMRTGVVRNALPFDVEEFVKQIGGRA